MLNYRIMTEIENPQFMLASLYYNSCFGGNMHYKLWHIFFYKTVYLLDKMSQIISGQCQWFSTTQFIGIDIGTISLLSRYFANLSDSFFVKRIWKHVKFFIVESYWTRILRDWKDSGVLFPSSSRKFKIVFQYLQNSNSQHMYKNSNHRHDGIADHSSYSSFDISNFNFLCIMCLVLSPLLDAIKVHV